MTPSVVVTSAGPVEVAQTGSGPVVLVVHGTPGDWAQARGLAEDLAATHRVLLPSRPGYGHTPLSTGRSPREQGAAHAALLDALGVERAAVVGISGGGPSSRAFAAHHRDRCTHLVLCCAVAEHLIEVPTGQRLLGALPWLWEGAARAAVVRVRRRLRDPEALLVKAFADLGPGERDVAAADPRVRDDLLAFHRDQVRVLTSVAGLRNDFRRFHEANEPSPWPPGPVVPTLVLHGDADTVVTLAHGEAHRDQVPGAVLEVLPGVGHAFVVSLRRSISARIAGFLETA